jgi:hypothetical protein
LRPAKGQNPDDAWGTEVRRVGPACVYAFEGGEPDLLVFNEVITIRMLIEGVNAVEAPLSDQM